MNMYLNATIPNWDEVCAENMVNSMELAMFIAQSVGLTVEEPQEETAKEKNEGEETAKETDLVGDVEQSYPFHIKGYRRKIRRKANFSHRSEREKKALRKKKGWGPKDYDYVPGWWAKEYSKKGTVTDYRMKERERVDRKETEGDWYNASCTWEEANREADEDMIFAYWYNLPSYEDIYWHDLPW